MATQQLLAIQINIHTNPNDSLRSVHSSQEGSYQTWPGMSPNTETDDNKQPTQLIESDLELQSTPQHSINALDDDDEKQSQPPSGHRSNVMQTVSIVSTNAVSEPSHYLTRYLKKIGHDAPLQLDPCVNWARAGTVVAALTISIVPSTLGIYLAPQDKTLNMTLDITSIVCTVSCMCFLMHQATTYRASYCGFWLPLFVGLVAVPVTNIVNIFLNEDNVEREQMVALIASLSAFVISTFAACSKMWRCQYEPDISDRNANLLLQGAIDKADYMSLKENETKQLEIKHAMKQEDTKQLELKYKMLVLQQQSGTSTHEVEDDRQQLLQ